MINVDKDLVNKLFCEKGARILERQMGQGAVRASVLEFLFFARVADRSSAIGLLGLERWELALKPAQRTGPTSNVHAPGVAPCYPNWFLRVAGRPAQRTGPTSNSNFGR